MSYVNDDPVINIKKRYKQILQPMVLCKVRMGTGTYTIQTGNGNVYVFNGSVAQPVINTKDFQWFADVKQKNRFQVYLGYATMTDLHYLKIAQTLKNTLDWAKENSIGEL